MAQHKRIQLGTMRLWVWSLSLLSGLSIQRCHELWCRPVAVAPIGPLDWEPSYAASVALKSKKKKKKKIESLDFHYPSHKDNKKYNKM